MKNIIVSLLFLVVFLLSSCASEIIEKETFESELNVVESVVPNSVKETIKIENEDSADLSNISKEYNKKGNYYIQYVSGNIVEGKQWKYEIKNSLMYLDDEMVNFYDIESKTEVGDLGYFFRAEKDGEEIITWTLYDIKTNEEYYKVILEFEVDKEKDKDGHNTFTLISAIERDNRTSDMSAYKFDEPEIMEHGEGNG